MLGMLICIPGKKEFHNQVNLGNNELDEIKQVSLLYGLSNVGMCCKFLKGGWSMIHFPNLFDKTIFSSVRIG